MRLIKLSVLAFSLLVLATSISLAQSKSAWKVFKPKGSIFAVSMPGTPRTQTQTVSDPGAGNIEIKIHIVMSDALYFVQDMKAAKLEPDHAKILRDFEGGFMKTSGATLVSSEATKFKGYVARNMLFKKDTKRIKGIAFIASSRIMSFFATIDEPKLKSEAVTKFFNSIKINGK